MSIGPSKATFTRTEVAIEGCPGCNQPILAYATYEVYSDDIAPVLASKPTSVPVKLLGVSISHECVPLSTRDTPASLQLGLRRSGGVVPNRDPGVQRDH